MKIRTKAVLEELTIDGEYIPLADDQTIDLEFSAIDSGGGFKDPMLDFSVSISEGESVKHQQSDVTILISNPADPEQCIHLSFEGTLTKAEGQINGRLTEEGLTKEAINFVFKLLR